jgi:hypothetical protein
LIVVSTNTGTGCDGAISHHGAYSDTSLT